MCRIYDAIRLQVNHYLLNYVYDLTRAGYDLYFIF